MESLQGRYQSFNIPKKILARYALDKNQVGRAYSICIAEAKNNGNHMIYKRMIDDASSKGIKLDSIADYDPDWFKSHDAEFKENLARMENELKLHKTNNIAPSIQASCVELAKLHAKAGDYRQFEQYSLQARQIQAISLEVNFFYKILLFQSEQLEELKKFCRDNENSESFTAMAIEQKSIFANARAMHGILNIRSRDYFAALQALSEVNADEIQDLGLYSSLSDIARYLGVLGIFNYRRDELKSKLLAGQARQVLKNNLDALGLVESYLDADYEKFSNHLEKLFHEWGNDSYVEITRKQCYELVMEKVIKQYLLTVSKVSLDTLANTFRILPQEAEEISKILILTRQIPFKIDKVNKVLVCHEKDKFTTDQLAKKATKLVGNYVFEKQYAVLKVAFSNASGSRGKGKGGMFDSFE